MPSPQQQVLMNLAEVRERMAEACHHAGRESSSVKLVAVTKYASLELTRAVLEAGCTDLGESRPQSLWTKAEALAPGKPRWHMIGHLQRNKVRRTLPLLSLLHSLDSIRLIEEVENECRSNDQTLSSLLEVNISGDAAKHGFLPEELPPIVRRWPTGARLRPIGLMAMAGLETSRSEARRQFAQLRELRDCLQADAAEDICLRELSMGMSNDFEEAILEGATLVRIGSTLMEGVEL